MNKKHKVLFDLWITFLGGYAGIPQDTRLNFDVLSQCDNVELDGFSYTKKKTLNWRRKPVSMDVNENLVAGNDFLFDAIADVKRVENTFFRKLKIYWQVEISNTILKQRYGLYPFVDELKETLWRCFFSKTLSADDKQRVMQGKFFYSDISWRDIMLASYFMRKTYLNTDGYDFIIFPDARPVTVSKGTKKIVRYHDSFPILCPDFFQTYHSLIHLNSVKACADDSYFVCNSEPTRETLVEMFPEIEKRSFVIPPVVKQQYSKVNSWEAVKQVCLSRASSQLVKQDHLPKLFAQNSGSFDYILALSTLEPRKNYLNLIRAWENLYYRYSHSVKLIIVANPGWLAGEIESIMKPHIELGNIIHLHNVSSEELPYLFSHAKFFASLSYIEGFGIPPTEAMQCECPVLASDNSTHRWSMGDAVVYANPYDVSAITDAMAKLLCLDGAEQLREQLAKKGLERVKRYSVESVKAQWSEMLSSI